MDALKPLVAVGLLVAPAPAAAEPLAQWRPYIAEAARRFAVPEKWIMRVMRAESAGATHLNGAPIRSSAGAMGLMQLMPATWATMRDTHGLGRDPDDPRDNILAGTAYLRMMYDRFGYPGLFGAYNAGPGRYAAHLESGVRLPGETRDYMAKVTGDVPASAPPAMPDSAAYAIYEPPPPTVFAVPPAGAEMPADTPSPHAEKAVLFVIRKVVP